jgi:hypothetical protein
MASQQRVTRVTNQQHTHPHMRDLQATKIEGTSVQISAPNAQTRTSHDSVNPKSQLAAPEFSTLLSTNNTAIRAQDLNSVRNRGKRDLTLMASMAYSTWNSRPSGEKVFTPRSYSVLRPRKTHREISPNTTTSAPHRSKRGWEGRIAYLVRNILAAPAAAAAAASPRVRSFLRTKLRSETAAVRRDGNGEERSALPH